MTEDHKELLERLEARHTEGGPRSVRAGHLRNRDGPEAATAIRALQAERDALRRDHALAACALNGLADLKKIIGNDDRPGRVKVAGAWYSGPLADAYIDLVEQVSDTASGGLRPSPANTAGGGE